MWNLIVRKSCESFLLVLLAFLVLSGCGNPPTSTSSDPVEESIKDITISGKIPLAQKALNSQGERDIATAVASVAAFPIVAANIIGNQPATNSTIKTDSSFAIALPPATTFASTNPGSQQPGAEIPTFAETGLGAGYVLLLTNPDATMPKDKVNGIIAINNDSYHIVDIPTGTAISDIDLGQLLQKGDEAQSSLQIGNGVVFNVSNTDLASYALIDNVYKDAKNIYCNHDSTGDFEMHPQFMWNLDGLASTPNSWTPVDSIDYKGYIIHSRTNKTALNLRGIVDGSYLVKIVAPETLSLVPLNSSEPQAVDFVTNEGMSETVSYSSDRKDWISADGLLGTTMWENGSGTIDLGLNGTVNSKVIPEGWWSIINMDSTHLADFDLGPLTPFDAEGNYRFIFPSLKFTVDNGNFVSQVDVLWYAYDLYSGRYIDVTGSPMFGHLVSSWFLSFTDGNGTIANGGKRVNFRPSLGTTLSDRWKYFNDTSESDLVLGHVQVFLQIGSDLLGQGTSITIDFHS